MNIIFAGTPEFAVPALKALINTDHQLLGVLTQPDRPAGRGQKLQMSMIKQVAQAANLTVWQPISLRKTDIQNQLQNLKPDVIIVAAYGLILPSEVLTIPRYGCINIHASLLPRWRGAAPIHRALLAGDAITGITIMQMDQGLDTGAMLAKIETPILTNETLQSLHDRLAILGSQALIKVLANIDYYLAQAQQQNEGQATYASKIQKNEAQVDWQQSAINIERLIRTFYPKGAYSFLENQLIKIQQADFVVGKTTSHYSAGTIVDVDLESIIVTCNEGQLRIKQMQLASGKSLPVSELLKAHKNLFKIGSVFQANKSTE